MSSLCFVCQLPILSHQTWGTWPHQPDSDTDPQDDEPQEEDEEEEDEEDRVALLASTGDNTSSKSDSAACLTSVSSSIASAITRNCRSPQEARTPGDGAPGPVIPRCTKRRFVTQKAFAPIDEGTRLFSMLGKRNASS
ncbi:hypothetical protein MRX96_036234 [Rhipicephalus microplus]